MKQTLRLLLAFAGLAALTACDHSDPEADFYNRVTVTTADNASDVEAQLVSVINNAETSVKAAFEDFDSVPVAEALVAAQARGVTVQVVGDTDHMDDAGFLHLLSNLEEDVIVPGSHPDADPEEFGVPVIFGNGELDYSPQPNAAVYRQGDMNRMTNNFLVVDGIRVINWTGGLEADSNGQLIDTLQIGFDMTSEDMANDFDDEFRQMFSGVFCTNLDRFNALQKSNTNPRRYYPTQEGVMEVFFGPQERTLKMVIDEVYNAKSSVWVMSEEFTNGPLQNALRYKASAGFDVKVILDRDLVGVPYSQEGDLVQYVDGADTGEVRYNTGVRQTVVVIDAEPGGARGRTGRAGA